MTDFYFAKNTYNPIEIKQAAIPNNKVARHMSVLEKAEGYNVGVKTILAQVDQYYLLAEDVLDPRGLHKWQK